MKNYAILALLFFNLTACSSDSGTTDTTPTVLLDSYKGTTTVSETGEFNLTIDSYNSTITIKAGNKIKNLTLSGFSNIITFEEDMPINQFNATASSFSNTVYIPIGSSISFTTDTGFSNTIIEQ